MLIRFGVNDTPTCPECRSGMRLSRRSPHPVRGYDYEMQTFTCRSCQHDIVRAADVSGEVAA